MVACKMTRIGLAKCAWLIAGALPLAGCVDDGPDNEPARERATFRSLGFLPGYAASRATAASSDGTIVVGTASTIDGQNQAFRWNAQQGLGGLGFVPGGTSSMATAVSADGAVVVGSGDAANGDPPAPAVAFRWAAAGMQRVDSLPGSSLCHAGGVSGDGTLVVGTCLQINNSAFVWTAETGAVALSRFGGGSNQQSTAAAISRDGGSIVGTGHPSLTGAVMWTANGSAAVLGKLPGDVEGSATAVSRDGSIVVGSSMDPAGSHRMFRWTQQGGMVALGGSIESLRGSFATSMSGDGRIVVGWGSTPAGEVALIWDAEHGLRRLDAALSIDYQTEIAGWSLQRATAVSGDARTIAGYGANPQGQTEAWIIELPD